MGWRPICLVLTEVAGLPLAGVPFVLALFGLGMVVGNLVGALLAVAGLGVFAWALADARAGGRPSTGAACASTRSA